MAKRKRQIQGKTRAPRAAKAAAVSGGAVRSMTGFGAATVPIPNGRLTVEIRTVNQRFLDVRITAPREYAAWEATCREKVRGRIARGRVEVHLSRNAPAIGRSKVVVDLEAAREHAAAWRKLARELRIDAPLDLALFRTGDVVQTVEVPGDVAGEFPAATRALEQALERHDRERRREGANLARDMRARIDRLAEIEHIVRQQASASLSDTHTRLTERIGRLLQGAEVDAARITQEAALLAERSDVTEELVRLESHLDAIRTLLGSTEPVGKQIEFLLQEVHREVNTVGSKVNNLDVTKLVIEAKGETERLKEQVQNLE